jgi:hypothetical protein
MAHHPDRQAPMQHPLKTRLSRARLAVDNPPNAKAVLQRKVSDLDPSRLGPGHNNHPNQTSMMRVLPEGQKKAGHNNRDRNMIIAARQEEPRRTGHSHLNREAVKRVLPGGQKGAGRNNPSLNKMAAGLGGRKATVDHNEAIKAFHGRLDQRRVLDHRLGGTWEWFQSNHHKLRIPLEKTAIEGASATTKAKVQKDEKTMSAFRIALEIAAFVPKANKVHPSRRVHERM